MINRFTILSSFLSLALTHVNAATISANAFKEITKDANNYGLPEAQIDETNTSPLAQRSNHLRSGDLTIDGGNIDAILNRASSIMDTFRANALTQRLAMTTLNGAHHRLLIDSALDKNGWHTWSTGDFAHFDKIDSTQIAGEIGASRGFLNDSLRIGFGLGHTDVDQNTIFNGSSDIEGRFALIEANYKFTDQVILSSLFYYGGYNIEMKRGYALGGTFSEGETDAGSMAIRLRTDWKNALILGDVSISPRLAYTYINTRLSSYQETGGALPAAYDKQNNIDHEIRLGVDFDFQYNEQTQFRTIIEIIHRFNDSDNLTGSSAGLIFDYPHEKNKETWGRIGFEAVNQLNDRASVNASIFTSTEGYDATISGAIGISLQF